METEKREKGEKRETYLKVTFEVVLVSRKSKGRALHWLKLKSSTATTEQEHMSLLRDHRPCGLMDKALVFGTQDCRFESCQGQKFGESDSWIESSSGSAECATAFDGRDR